MKKLFPLLIMLLPICCFSGILFQENSGLSTAINAITKNIPATGTVEASGQDYYYINVNQAFIKKAYTTLQPFLIKQNQTCFHKPSDLGDHAHITLATHYSPALQPYLGKTITFKPNNVMRITITTRRHHHREKHIWYAIEVTLENPKLNQLFNKLHPNDVYHYHISFAVAKYDAKGQCIRPHTTTPNQEILIQHKNQRKTPSHPLEKHGLKESP